MQSILVKFVLYFFPKMKTARKNVRASNRETENHYNNPHIKERTEKRRTREEEALLNRVNAVHELLQDTAKQMKQMGYKVELEWKGDKHVRNPITKKYSTQTLNMLTLVTDGIREPLMNVEIDGNMNDGGQNKYNVELRMGWHQQHKFKDIFHKNGRIKGKVREDIQRAIVKDVAELTQMRKIGLLSQRAKYK